MYNVGLPLVLVYSVSCLEEYLKENYFFLRGIVKRKIHWNELKEMCIQLIADDTLIKDIEKIREKRHVIIHNGGFIDKEATNNIQDWRQLENQYLPLNTNIMKEDVEIIKKFATSIQYRISQFSNKNK